MNRHFISVYFCAILWTNLSIANTLGQVPLQLATLGQCNLTSGKIIAACHIGYRTYGKLNNARSNVVLVPTWYSGTSDEHAYLATPELLNPNKYFIVIVDSLSNGVSSSPTNSKTQPDGQFPEITITDMVNSQYRLLTEVLNIQSLHGIFGLSMGGMQAFEWSVRYPGFAKKTVAAIGSPRFSSFDIALWTTRNRLLILYRKCQCKEALEALEGIRMLSQVPTKLTQNVAREEVISTIISQSESKIMSVGQSWNEQRQAEAMIKHNIALNFNNDLKKAAAQIQTKLLIILGADDRIVTPEPAREFAKLTDAIVVELDEDCGHGDPWCAKEEFNQAVSAFFNND